MRKQLFIISCVLVFCSCAGLLINRDARTEFDNGLSLFNHGRYGEAVPHFHKATEIYPKYTEAIEIAPKNLDAYLGLARAFLKDGDYADAMAVVNDAVKKIAASDEERAPFWDLIRQY